MTCNESARSESATAPAASSMLDTIRRSSRRSQIVTPAPFHRATQNGGFVSVASNRAFGYGRGMRWLLTIAVAVLLLAPSGASAVTLVNPDRTVAQPYQHWADLSAVPTVPGTVTVALDLGPCSGRATVHACFNLRTSEMYLDGTRCGMQGPSAWRLCRFAVSHELGHPYDDSMPEWKRTRFAALMGVTDAWDQIDMLGGSLRENFADVYAWCAMRDPNIFVGGRFMPDLSPRNFRRACHLIRIPNTA